MVSKKGINRKKLAGGDAANAAILAGSNAKYRDENETYPEGE